MKFSEIRHLEEKELWLKLSELRKKLFSARIQLTQKRLSNPLSIRFLRRDIARLQTALSLSRKKPPAPAVLKSAKKALDSPEKTKEPNKD